MSPRSRAGPRETLEVDGRTLVVSSLDKLLYPAAGFTKRDLLDYYRAVAPVILPHLADRALTLGRWPDGVEAAGWFQSNCRGHPPWLRTVDVTGRRGQALRYCVVDDVAGLAWVANLGTIELHPSLATVGRPDEPRLLVFDLDPGAGVGPLGCAEVALELRQELAARGLSSWVKSSGQKGLHVCVPLNGGATFAETKPFARAMAQLLSARRPDAIVDRMALAARAGRVFIDWGQNDRNKQTVAPWSLRATPVPRVAAPLEWDALVRAVDSRDAAPLYVTPAAARARARAGDPFAETLTRVQALL